MSWPLFFKESLTIKNPASSLAICSLWTPRKTVVSLVEDFNVAGQLYSVEGISFLLRNLLANPTITDLLLVGRDMNGVGDQLVNFWVGNPIKLHPEITEEYQRLIRGRVKLHDMPGVIKPQDIAAHAALIDRRSSTGESIIILPYSEPSYATVPAPDTGYMVSGETIPEVYARLVERVMTFGKRSCTQHSSDQLELLNVAAHIENPPADNWLDWMPFTQEEATKYDLIRPSLEDGVAYTYGSRLRNFEGVDQLESLIDDLWQYGASRRAVASLWRAEDASSGNPPCLITIQARVREAKVYLTAYFRSHDMYRAWALNAIGLSKLQTYIANTLGLYVGTLSIFSSSAHVYEHDWEEAKGLVARTRRWREQRHDPNGSFYITVESDAVVVRHFYQGEHVQTFREKDQGLLESRVSKFVGTPMHAFYLGRQLTRAFVCLQSGKEFVQDA